MRRYQICQRCIMDTSDPDIVFDDRGICNHCKRAEQVLNMEPYCLFPEEKGKRLQSLVETIKQKGANKPYDCIIGLSGGVDSSYVAHKVKELGLRPLAVHLDNGWDSELSVQNIENICRKLDIDLYTWVLDWEEFKDLQVAFLRASTPDSEIPSDNAIVSVLYKMASEYGVKYILAGNNVSSESILPNAWSRGHLDARYIKSVQKRYGLRRLKKFPLIGAYKIAYYRFLDKIKLVNFLDYLDYDKNQAKAFIMAELDWRDYGRKHCESNYTRIYQEYILPTKFGFDKRRAHLSSLIMAGQITREEALIQIEEPLYTSAEKLSEDIDYLVNKLGMDKKEFEEIMNSPVSSYFDFANQETTWYIKWPLNIYRRLRKASHSFLGVFL